MLGWLRSVVSLGSEEVTATVVDRTRSEDGETYTTTFREEGGRGRTFTETFSWHGLSGISAPKPRIGAKATLRVNGSGKVMYAGSAA